MAEFYEFFAGGGMARAGLGPHWTCRFANDHDTKKAASYKANWGKDHLLVDDVAKVSIEHLTGHVDLAWASFPCQDLSLAGSRAGLQGERSGTFWPFWRLMQGLAEEGRAPRMIVLENVPGLITSAGGDDFCELGKAIAALGYRLGAMVIDAVHFVPQSRQRLFVIAVAPGIEIPAAITRSDPSGFWHPRALVEAKFKLPKFVQDQWLWWNIPAPPTRDQVFSDLIEETPTGVQWNSDADTQALINMMSLVNKAKVSAARTAGTRRVGALYRRTREGIQRAEVRFDDVAGCLRTPGGGSSRQSILVVEQGTVKSRLLSPREAARLMGLPDDYVLPEKYNDAYHLMGDGLVVPVIAYLEHHILSPILQVIAAVPAAAA
ncbi:DNA cytosine methyltransferase [Paraburkholderia fungorum]|jgi:DNA (cytosine-5)-methyltransferase 1|uniref:DNA cytosine methyltransferase n=1 Tax=Paraburkholderia fungorum TaxID=134537 RepID=UPI00248F0858|nr:DNA cytosine methyltransferase [Paraburkholderia fungorum]